MAGKKSNRGQKIKEFHGKSHLPEYGVWQGILRRCLNADDWAYRWYGGRGITVCDRWMNSFSAFFDDMGPRADGQGIDRINNDGNYEPSNCRWASREVNTRNRSIARMLTFNGETKNLIEWSNETGVSSSLFIHRVKTLGWSEEKAMFTPPRLLRLTHGGLTLTMKEWAKHTGIRRATIQYRICQGWDIDRALTVTDGRKS